MSEWNRRGCLGLRESRILHHKRPPTLTTDYNIILPNGSRRFLALVKSTILDLSLTMRSRTEMIPLSRCTQICKQYCRQRSGLRLCNKTLHLRRRL